MTCQDQIWQHLSESNMFNTPPFTTADDVVYVTIRLNLVGLLPIVSYILISSKFT